MKIDIFRAFYRFLVVFFLFVFVLATSHPIRPTTLIFGKLVQCDLKRTEKKFVWTFSFFTILGPIFMFFNFYISFRSLQITVYGTGTNYLCLTSSYNTRKKVKKKVLKILKIGIFRGIFHFFLLYLCICHRSPHSTYKAHFWHVGSKWLR